MFFTSFLVFSTPLPLAQIELIEHDLQVLGTLLERRASAERRDAEEISYNTDGNTVLADTEIDADLRVLIEGVRRETDAAKAAKRTTFGGEMEIPTDDGGSERSGTFLPTTFGGSGGYQEYAIDRRNQEFIPNLPRSDAGYVNPGPERLIIRVTAGAATPSSVEQFVQRYEVFYTPDHYYHIFPIGCGAQSKRKKTELARFGIRNGDGPGQGKVRPVYYSGDDGEMDATALAAAISP